MFNKGLWSPLGLRIIKGAGSEMQAVSEKTWTQCSLSLGDGEDGLERRERTSRTCEHSSSGILAKLFSDPLEIQGLI